jgi:hypothetical protein
VTGAEKPARKLEPMAQPRRQRSGTRALRSRRVTPIPGGARPAGFCGTSLADPRKCEIVCQARPHLHAVTTQAPAALRIWLVC